MNTKRPGRGPQISKEVRRLIISEAIHDSRNMPRRALAVRLEDLIEKMGEVSPTEDTLAKMISEARNKQPSELDRPWSVGACAEYNVPPGIIPVLINLQTLKVTEGARGNLGTVTIREAQWFARLFPVAEPIINKAFIDNESRLRLLSLIVTCYVERERVSQRMNEPYPDTGDIDKIFFANDDLMSEESLAAWWGILPQRYQIAVAAALEPYRQMALSKVEQVEGRPLTSEEKKMVNDLYEAARTGGPVALRDWANQHMQVKKYGIADLDWGTVYSEGMKEVWNERQNNQT